MSQDLLENLTGVEFPNSGAQKAVMATGGKPSRVFPFLIKDFSLFAYFDKDLYRFNGKYYDVFTDLDIDRLTRKFYLENSLEDKYNLAKSRELKAMVKFDPNIVVEDFDNYDNLVNLANGVYNYDTKELYPHDYVKYKFTYALNINLEKDKTECPNFIRFLQGCFADSGSWDEGYVYDEASFENIIRLCGYLLYPINTIEGIFIFLGEGSNGKSVLMDTLRLFFPSKYVTNLSLNAISNEDGFTREKLIRSRVNFSSEQRGGSINSEELKKVSSGEDLTVQRKFNQAMDFRSHTKICVSSNNMPYFNDSTYAILRRLSIFNFKNKFVDSEDYDGETDHIARRIFKGLNKNELRESIKNEREAIFNMFLGGLERLRDNGWKFLPSKNMEDVLEEYKAGSDTLGTWISEHYEKGGEGDFISINDIYTSFRDWYENNYNKKCTYSSISVGKKIKDKFRFPDSVSFSQRVDGVTKTITGYQLKFKAEASALEELMNSSFGVEETVIQEPLI